MSAMNYPDFLNTSNQNGSSSAMSTSKNPQSQDTRERKQPDLYPSGNNYIQNVATNKEYPPQQQQQQQQQQFNNLLLKKLSALDDGSPLDVSSFYTNASLNKDSFNLPAELQGGVSNISSRRPSYAAESFTRNNFYHQPSLNPQSPQLGAQSSNFFNNRKDLSSIAMFNNYAHNHYQHNGDGNFDINDSFSNLNLNTKFNDFQSRRPSQLADFSFSPFGDTRQPQQQPQQHQQQQQQQQQQHQAPNQNPQHQSQSQQPLTGAGNNAPFIAYQNKQTMNSVQNQSMGQGNPIKLENGLMLRDQYIVASPELKSLYMKTIKYFQDQNITADILSKLNNLLTNPVIIKLITFIKNLNNLTFNHKILCLVINKNGKFDLLSYPHNSNIFLQKNDLVIVDGDRGKDLVMIVEPLVNLNFAILFNFLKKLEHLKSLTIIEGHVTKTNGGTHPTTMDASTIINSHSNEDNEFIITLPTKQVLRFATPKEVHKISGKFLEEKKAFITCYNKIKELNLDSDLSLINVEYQCDFKKLIFYYFAGFKRIDFRGLIKELFKIYKTRIWLCAVLPYNKPELYITMDKEDSEPNLVQVDNNLVPREYELTNDQILNFSINEFDNLATPSYFHSKNVLNLIKHMTNEIKGHFYGFNTGKIEGNYQSMKTVDLSDRSRILPNFNPFGDFQ
ncbi:growth-and/or replication-involved protein, putative [Candida dubliniensis CD36]|uniref:Growth-and/or replication-involved protein, putative n=1 Tax=Candida dubliniensis (strain CD36 / ATCC MYA-646 / CBS 7987 / NCPF 3949 / NRRL Y-17841) TaxID=573826 RepID=B9W9D3_CANDC|nr:growth-and/or replication-involved protein, putative [Candida dubliniensis CD36]CAX45415.1 growth-and/or replication-involved protein, putative [Candida dubliniensis CD36]